MNEMVERAARKISPLVMPYDEFDERPERAGAYSQETIREIARAAIAAMREPTEAMISSVPVDEWCAERYPPPEETWRAMIDEAMK